MRKKIQMTKNSKKKTILNNIRLGKINSWILKVLFSIRKMKKNNLHLNFSLSWIKINSKKNEYFLWISSLLVIFFFFLSSRQKISRNGINFSRGVPDLACFFSLFHYFVVVKSIFFRKIEIIWFLFLSRVGLVHSAETKSKFKWKLWIYNFSIIFLFIARIISILKYGEILYNLLEKNWIVYDYDYFNSI